MIFACDKCEYTFREKKNLQQHRRKEHGLKNISVSNAISLLMIIAMYRDMKNQNMKMKYLNISNVSILQMINLTSNAIFETNIP